MYMATLATAAPGRLERRKAKTRAAIIAAASRLFHERGYEETSIQHIAELADTGVGTLYGYFESKDDILREVLQTERDEALERYFASITERSSHIERACKATEALATYLKHNRIILTAAFQVGARNRHFEESQASWLHNNFREMIQEGIAAGEFRALPVDATVRMLIGTTMLAMLGIGNWAGQEDKPETLRDIEEITRAVLAC
jgi:AcrR family transcriptional regulator